MKNIIKTATILLTLLLASAQVASGQDYIKELTEIHTDTCIVREYKDSSRIIYNEKGGVPTFIMVTENGITAQMMSVDAQFVVSDMVIADDTLFFCGIGWTGSIVGVFGFIPLATFPSVGVIVDYLPMAPILEKMEFLKSKYGGRHLIVTGGNRIYDFRETTYSWAIEYVTGIKFSDVAVTDNYVVVSGIAGSDNTGYLYYFGHPVPGYSIFYNPIFKYVLPDVPKSRILLEACQADGFVVTYKTEYEGRKWIDVIGVNGFSFYNQVRIIANTGSGITNHYPIDVKFNQGYRMTDVLTTERTSSQRNSVIYHIDATGTVTGRRYDAQGLLSLDYLNLDPVHFIAAGYEDEDRTLRFYKYDPAKWWHCSDVEEPTYHSVQNEFIPKEIELDIHTMYEPLTVENASISYPTVKIRCYYDMKADEEQINDEQ